MRKEVESKAKCPKCKSDNLFLIECWENHTITWEQVASIFDRNDGALEPGDAFKVEGRCRNCDHRWTFRNVLQIDDLIV